MPFPVHPRPGHSPPRPSIRPSTISPPSFGRSSRFSSSKRETSTGIFSGRNVLLASLSISLALAIALILAFQFGLIQSADGRLHSQFSEVRIRLENGGGEETSIFGRKLAVGSGDYFLDIPYSTGTPRFQQAILAPLPRDFYAIHHGNGCPNGFTRTRPFPDLNWNPPPLETVPAAEQCHTLNIYRCTAGRSVSQLLPVLVVISEGDWLKRSNANLEPTAAIRGLACNGGGADGDGGGGAEMLVVALNYRMGPFGHFQMPGWPEQRRNFALWDIRTGLEWVQQNIIHFGGHKAHVTVMARGQGARLVSLLGMLPQGRGLFKRQVLISGSAFSPTLLQPSQTLAEGSFDPSMHLAIAANCANEREWQNMTTAAGENVAELRARVEKCMAEAGAEALIAAESRVRAPAFLRWPIVTDGSASLTGLGNNFSVPQMPFSDLPPVASLIGFCTHPANEETTMQKGTTTAKSGGFQKRLEEAIRAELAERMGQMADFSRGQAELGSEVIRHYLEAVEMGNGLMREPDALFEQIRADFSLAGPALLDALARARVSNARVYGFTYQPPAGLNLSLLDAAEAGARDTNAWASAQLACVDDLLFNSRLPKGFEAAVRPVTRQFAQRLAAFVAFGEPNSDGAGDAALAEWPIAFARANEGPIGAEAPRWLRLGQQQQKVSIGLEQLLLGGGQFWLCQLPRRFFGLDLMAADQFCASNASSSR